MIIPDYRDSRWHKKYINQLSKNRKIIYFDIVLPTIVNVLQNTHFKMELVNPTDDIYYVLKTVNIEDTKIFKTLTKNFDKKYVKELKKSVIKNIKSYLAYESIGKDEAKKSMCDDFKTLLGTALSRNKTEVLVRVPRYSLAQLALEYEKTGIIEDHITIAKTKTK